MPDPHGRLRPVGDRQHRFGVHLLGPPRHRFMVGPMTDIEFNGRIGRIRTSQLLSPAPPPTIREARCD